MSNKAIGWLVFILLLAVGIAGGYFFYQYKSKQIVTDLIAQLSPVVDISFTDLAVDLEGRVELLGVRIAPIGYQDVVLIDKVDIVSGSAITLIGASNWIKGGLPEKVDLQFSSVIFDIDSDFMQSAGREEPLAPDVKTLWGLACAQETDFSTLATQLGLSRLQVDAQVKVQLDSSGRVFKAAAAVSVPGLSKALFEFEINSKVPLDFYDRTIMSRAQVTYASVDVSDVGFNLKRTKYCAKQEGIKESSYPDFFKAIVQLKMLGEQDSALPELDESILAFFAPRENIMLRLTPSDPLYLPQVFSQSFNLFTAKGLKLSVNKKVVSSHYLPLLKGHSIETLIADDEREILTEFKEKVIQRIEVKKKARFRSVDFSELFSLQGQKIRLQTNVGKELEGVLLEVSEDKIIMRRRVEQGVVTYPVDKKNIATIKVFR